MSVFATWGGGDGDWFSAGNWSEPNPNPPPPTISYVPNDDNYAIFNGSVAYTVTYAGGVDGIAGIGGDDGLVTLDLTGGQLTVGTGGGGLYALETAAGATFAVDDNGAIFLPGAVQFRISGSIDNAGEIQLNAADHSTRLIVGEQTTPSPVTLSGGGSLVMSDNSNNSIFIDNDASLDNVDNTISGAGLISANFTSLTNEAKGVIDATGAANNLVLAVPTIINKGLIEDTGVAGLQISNAGVGVIVDNEGGVISAAGAGAHVDIDGGEVIGGQLSGSGGGVFNVLSGASVTLDGTDEGALTLSAGARLNIEDDAVIRVIGDAASGGGIVNQGVIALDATGRNTGIIFGEQTTPSPVTLSGGGSIVMSDNANNSIFIDNSASLDNIDNTFSGAGSISSNFTSITNEAKGVIDATGENNKLVLTVPTVTNKGLIEDTGTAGLQLSTASGSTTVDNQGGAISAVGAGAHVDFDGGDIVGGELNASGGGEFRLLGFTTEFDGETDGALTIAAGTVVKLEDGASLNLVGASADGGGIVNKGEIELNSVVFTTRINISESATSTPLTLSGGGSIVMSDNANNQIFLGNSTILDNIDNTISGAGGIGANFTSMTNEAKGVIDATGTLNKLVLTVPTITNLGLIEDTGAAGLQLSTASGSTTVDNQGGAISAVGAGAHVDFDGGDVVGGQLTASGGGEFRLLGNTTEFDGETDGALTIAAGTVVKVEDGASLNLAGAAANGGGIVNKGEIELNGATAATRINISESSTSTPLTLSGGGSIVMSDSADNQIFLGNSTILDNIDNTISGAGSIGANFTSMTNEAKGVIDATGTNHGLYIGLPGVTNLGLLEDTGAGGLVISNGVITNTGGTIAANGAGAHVDFSYQSNETVVGGTLTTSNGGVLNVESTVYLQGAVTVTGAFVGSGGAVDVNTGDTTFASGATLSTFIWKIDSGAEAEIDTSLTYAGLLEGSGNIVIDGANTLELTNGDIGSGAIDFAAGGAGKLKLDAMLLTNGQTFTSAIGGFSADDVIDLAGVKFAGNATPTYDSGSGILTITEGGVLERLTLTNPTTTQFVARADANGGTEIVCFAAGTLIRTAQGDAPVETLSVGDLVVTASGEARPIRWIGHRRVDCRAHPETSQVMPVRIAAHAFAPNRPARDLFVSPGHALCIVEALIPAIRLVNGANVRQIEVDEATYWHVELDSHDLLIAENLPAESYLDVGNRSFFREADVVDLAAGPDGLRSPLTLACFCRPFFESGPLVEKVRAHLHENALRQGWTRSDALAPHLEIGGRRIAPLVRDEWVRFLVPAGAEDVWLVSPAGRPFDFGGEDRRSLGLCLGALTLCDGFAPSETIALDDPRLGEGFHAVEDGVRRWTDGRARLPRALWRERAHDSFLTIRLAGAPVTHWLEPGADSDVRSQGSFARR